MQVLLQLIYGGVTPRRQLSLHLACGRGYHKPTAFDMNSSKYRRVFTHLVLNARSDREAVQGVLYMAWFLVHAIAILGSFYFRQLFFQHPYFVLAAWKLIWFLILSWYTCARPFPIWTCRIPFSGLIAKLEMVHRRGVSRHGGTIGNRGRVSHFLPRILSLWPLSPRLLCPLVMQGLSRTSPSKQPASNSIVGSISLFC